jgi:pilus assembly protein Flp/PilA
MNLIKRLIKEEEGQGLVEYALIVGLIALVCVAAITLAGTSVSNIWTTIQTKLQGADDVVNP